MSVNNNLEIGENEYLIFFVILGFYMLRKRAKEESKLESGPLDLESGGDF